MKRTTGLLLLILFLTGSKTPAQIEDYYKKNFQNMGSSQQQSSSLSSSTLSTPVQGTVNMAIILCVEKGQPRNFIMDQFIDQLKQNIPDYFAKATFNNFTINRIDVLVDSTDTQNNTAYAFELPGYLASNPSVTDTSYVCNPWMVRNVLARADKKYNFANYDYNNDGTVDMVDFIVIRHTSLHNGGTVGLSTHDIYTTNDPYQGGGYMKIDGSDTRDSNGLLHSIIRKYNAEDFDSQLTHIVHELGHAFFDFEDYDHKGYELTEKYFYGQFCAMSAGGFNKIASPYNPFLRIIKGWASVDEITNSKPISFISIEKYPNKVYWHQAKRPTNNSPIGNWAFTYHEFLPVENNRWIENWPLPRNQADNSKRGVLVWDLKIEDIFSPAIDHLVDMEAAHGRWNWITTYNDVKNLNDRSPRKPLRSNVENPLTGLDSMDVRNSYVWEVWNPATDQYDVTDAVYLTDKRIGSASCFFDPIHPKTFSFYTNPNSCGDNQTSIQTYQSMGSGFSMENLRLENGSVKADFKVGDEAYIVKEDATLTKGEWMFYRSIVVNPGVTLRIQPGACIRFARKTTTTSAASLIVKGTLIANGTESEKITFEFYGQSETDQNGIKFELGSSGDSISNAIIKNAYNGIFLNQNHCVISHNEIFNCYHGIYAYNIDNVSGLTQIDHNYIYNCGFASLSTINSSPMVLNNEFSNSSGVAGVYIVDNSMPKFGDINIHGNNNIHNNINGIYSANAMPLLGGSQGNNWAGHNIIENNSDFNLAASDGCLIWATNNWWGSNVQSEIEGKIDYEASCVIYYDPWLQQRPVFSMQMNSSSESVDAGNQLKKSSSIASGQGNPIIDKLIKAENSLLVKDYLTAQRLSQEIMESYPDDAYAINAMDIFRASTRDNSSTSLKSFLNNIASKKSNTRLNAYTDLLLANSDIKQKAKLLDDIAIKYKDNPFLEKILLSRLLYYFHEENNYEKALNILDELEKKFPDSESSFFAHCLLKPEPVLPNLKLARPSRDNMSQEDEASSFKLLGNFPNPSNPSTVIKYSLPTDCRVSVSIYDILGKEIYSYQIRSESEGNHSITWNGLNSYGEQATSGIYIYKIRAVSTNDGTVYEKSSKMIMMK